MRLFLKISKDLRYLLHEYDSDFPEEELVEVYENIMLENERLTGTKEYSHYFERLDYTEWEKQLLIVIDAVILCLHIINPNTGFLDTEGARYLIDEYNLKLNGKKIEIIDNSVNKEAKKQLESLSKSIQNRMKIRAYKEAEEDIKDEKIVTWEELRVGIHVTLGVMPEYDCSVTQYRMYEKTAKELIRQRQKHGK